jgi:hypothetical protein
VERLQDSHQPSAFSLKFPDAHAAPGSSIRAGDFGEVLVADFVEYALNCRVPRTRYADTAIRNESTKGSDETSLF